MLLKFTASGPHRFSLIMIKIITTVVCAFAAIIMIILSMATNYWLQWMVVSSNTNITHYRGLFEHCWETRDNITDELIKEDSGCDGKNLVEELTSGKYRTLKRQNVPIVSLCKLRSISHRWGCKLKKKSFIQYMSNFRNAHS